MGAFRETRNGKIFWVAKKRLPDGTDIRRTCANKTTAEKLCARIQESILLGTWREVVRELKSGPSQTYTIKEFWEKVFLPEYCKTRMRSWKRYELSFAAINEILGDIQITDFRRADAHRYVEKRSGKVSDATINRDLSALSSMFSYALDKEYIGNHPLVRFKKLKPDETEIRIPTPEQYQALIDELEKINHSVAALAVVIGETGLRYREALRLEWADINFRDQVLTVTGRAKSKKVRYIPLSPLAVEYLRSLPRRLHIRRVFVNENTQKPWENIAKVWDRARKKIGCPWMGRHTLRHFRITEWLRHGAMPHEVQYYAGHSSIVTTMRYVHLVKGLADRSLRAAQAIEAGKRE